MDVGLDGNIFNRSFDSLGHLAEHSWFKTLWEFCNYYSVDFSFDGSINIPSVRVGDCALMECFLNSGIFTRHQLRVLNRVRKYKKVHSLAEILRCDGKSVRPELLDYSEGYSTRIYSREKPRRKDFELWQSALQAITSPTLTRSPPLGPFIGSHPSHNRWFLTFDKSILFHEGSDGHTRLFSTQTDDRSSRLPVYEFQSETTDIIEAGHVASVDDSFDPYFVNLHSSAPIPVPVVRPVSFLAVLASFPNQSLWQYLRVDGDGEWIRRGLILGSIVVIHDGSYMPKVSENVCSAAVAVVCTRTGNKATVSIAECCPEADNYRAEALGALLGLLIIRAASVRSLPYKPCRAYCDNKGIVTHANSCHSPLKEKQSQADVIGLLKQYIRDLVIDVEYEHVFGHMDDVLRWDQLSFIQQWNVLMDGLAKRALLASLLNRNFIDEDLPFESFIVRCGQQKVRSSPVESIYRWWGYRTARALFHNRKVNRLDHSLFDLVYWKGMDKVMTSKFSRRFRVWMAKHVSGTCGVNHFLAKWDKKVEDRCPSCGLPEETTNHITVCTDSHRTHHFHKSVDDLESWLEDNSTDPILVELICQYLNERGSSSMVSIVHESWPRKYMLLAKYHDKLGWQHFVEGRILSLFVEYQRQYLRTIETYRTADQWAAGFIERLIRITHRQWLFRNAKVHFKRADGLTIAQHKRLTQRMKEALLIDPDDLLAEDRGLLDEDPYLLGKSSPQNQRYWIASVESAFSAACHARRKAEFDLDPESEYVDLGEDVVPIDSEGSIRYRKRRRKDSKCSSSK